MPALLLAAKNPIVVAEQSGRDPAAFKALVELAELIGAAGDVGPRRELTRISRPIIRSISATPATIMSKTPISSCSSVAARPGIRRIPVPAKGKIVAINDNQFKGHMIYQNLHADLYLEGDIAASLQALTQAARAAKLDGEAVKTRRAKWTREHERFVAGLKAEKAKARSANGKAIDPLTLVEALGEVMPADTIYVDETITHQPVVRQHLPFTTPQSFFRGFGGLGQGIGTALGVKLAARERPVALLVGDGGFLYNPIIQALGASKQHGLPILIVIFNNKRYLAMEKGHVHHYPDGAAEDAHMHLGSRLDGPGLRSLGRAFRLPRRARGRAGKAQSRGANGAEESPRRHHRHPQCRAEHADVFQSPGIGAQMHLIDARGPGRQHDQAIEAERDAGGLRHLRRARR